VADATASRARPLPRLACLYHLEARRSLAVDVAGQQAQGGLALAGSVRRSCCILVLHEAGGGDRSSLGYLALRRPGQIPPVNHLFRRVLRSRRSPGHMAADLAECRSSIRTGQQR
jgi:hypothetical protein